jgi:hypothetical protein
MSAAERRSDRQVNNRPQQRGFAAAARKLPNVAAVAKESGKDDGVRHIALYVIDVPSMERMETEKDLVASTRRTADAGHRNAGPMDYPIREKEGRMLRCALEPATMRSGRLELR